MIRTTFAALALLSTTPALAQSFYPYMYGARFCELRRMGIDAAQARKVAMDESWSNTRPSVTVTYNGKQVSTDVLDSANYVVRNCQELL